MTDQSMNERPAGDQAMSNQLDADERRTALQVVRGSRVIATVLGVLSLGAGIALLVWPDRTLTVVARLVGDHLDRVGLAGRHRHVGDRRDRSDRLPAAGQGVPAGHGDPVRAHGHFGVVVIAWPIATLSAIAFLVGSLLALFGLVLLWTAYELTRFKVV